MSEKVQATLYMRPGCHLCEEAQALLDDLRTAYPHDLALVDVEADPALEARYGQQIPVLAVGGITLEAPLSRTMLERALKDAR